MKKKNPWNKRNEQLFAQLYPTTKNTTLMIMFKISPAEIIKKAYEMGIEKQKRGVKGSTIMTLEQIEEFKELYPTTGTQELADRYGTKVSYMRHLAAELDVKKTHEYLSETTSQNNKQRWSEKDRRSGETSR